MRRVLGVLSEANYNFFYTGIDVVEDLINYNVTTFKSSNVQFICRDVANDNEPLPDGEILIIRQVLQHLSNADIKKILSKALKFKFLFVTESVYDGADAVFNIDRQNSGTASARFSQKSGIYLEHSPFNVKNIVHLLKIQEKAYSTLRSSLIIN